MIGTIDQYVDDPRRQRANRHMNFFRRSIALTCFMFGKFLGNYLVILYLFVKILYIVNCVGQLFLISILLGRNFYIYGASIFRDIIQGRGYADSEYFPRVTMCKFQVNICIHSIVQQMYNNVLFVNWNIKTNFYF